MIPVIILALVGIITLLLGVTESRKGALALVLIGVLAALGMTLAQWDEPLFYFNNMVSDTNFSALLSGIILLSAGLIFIMSARYYRGDIAHKADIYALMIFSTIGALLMVMYENLTMLFLGIEILSIPLYVLAASHKTDMKSKEAGLKYFILGAFTSSFLLLGIALIFGQTNSFDLKTIQEFVIQNGNAEPLMILGIFMLLIGLFFKIALAPFHFWTPDVYEGAPSLITVFMSTIVKIAAVAALYKFMMTIQAPQNWSNILSAILVLTLFLANFIALKQSSFKRLFAYSSISNAGLLMIPMLSLTPASSQSIIFYLWVYAIGNIAAFAVYLAAKENTQSDKISDLAGLMKSDRIAGITLFAAMLSLAGIPPLAGFLGKFLIIQNAVNTSHILVAICAVVASLIGVYYYLRVAIIAVFDKATHTFYIHKNYKIVMLICLALLILLGLYPSALLHFL